MGAEATAAARRSKNQLPPLPLPPVLRLVVPARSRPTTKVADRDGDAAAATPPRRPPVTVPFLWEDAPGKPKPHGDTAAAGAGFLVHAAGTRTTDDGVHQEEGDNAEAEPRPVPLKLPPRLLRVMSYAAEHPVSTKAVLHGPYAGATRPPRALRRAGTVASFQKAPKAGGRLFSWGKASAVRLGGGHDHLDASCSSPAASSASSSSSSSVSCFGDERGRRASRRPAEDSEEDEGAMVSVRITRFARTRSLPSMTKSHFWVRSFP
ncbi:hypothetical protein ACP4OV_010557 [Aristida adscensionis]